MSKRDLEQFRVKSFASPHPAKTSEGPSVKDLHGEPRPDDERVVLHFDVDAFYAQVEEVRNPLLRDVPLGVTQKYLLVTCNYVARAAGVTKLMSIHEAQQKCPGLVLISGEDLTPYRQASKSIISVLQRYGPAEKLGMDEVFVDVTQEVAGRLSRGVAQLHWKGHVHNGGLQLQYDNKYRPQDLRVIADTSEAADSSAAEGSLMPHWTPRLMVGSEVADEMRRVLKAETGFRSSAGIACNKMLAKMVSGLHKPDDQTVLPPTEAYAFLAPLPVRALPGVGYKTDAELTHKGINTVRELRMLTAADLKQQFGERAGAVLWSLCRGLDSSEVVPKGPPKSITVEDSFKGCSTWQGVRTVLNVLAPDLLTRMQEDVEEHNRRPTALTVKWRLRATGWARTSASAPLPSVLTSASASAEQQLEALISSALALLHRHLQAPFNLSLLNLGVTNFKAAGAEAGAASIKHFFTGGTPTKSKGHDGSAGDVKTNVGTRHARPSAAAAQRATFIRRDYNSAAAASISMSKHQERRAKEAVILRQLEATAVKKGFEVGTLILNILRRFAPDGQVEKASYDDFYLDVTAACVGSKQTKRGSDGVEGGAICDIADSGQPVGLSVVGDCGWERVEEHMRRGVQIAMDIRAALRSELNFTISCGVASSKLLARLVGPLNKPDGLSVLPSSAAVGFLHSQHLRDIPGLGQKAGQEVMEALGVKMVGELVPFTRAQLVDRFGKTTGELLANLALGRDERVVQDRGAQKSILCERSFPPMGSMEEVKTALRPLCETLLLRMAQDHVQTRRVAAKVAVHWRQGYSGGTSSKTASIPPQMKILLKAFLKEATSQLQKAPAQGPSASAVTSPVTGGLTEEQVARTPMCVNLWKFAANVLKMAFQAQYPKGGLQVTRLAVAVCFETTVATGGHTIDSFWSKGSK